MAGAGGFSASLVTDRTLGPVAVLAWDGAGEPARALEARIVPAFGANLARFSAGGRAVIDFDPALLAARDFTGTPVLFPTPNRVRGCRWTWRGREIVQRRDGRDVYEHGLAHLEAWEHDPPTADASGARFAARLDCRPGSPMHGAFPFAHRLSLAFTLDASGVEIAFVLRNESAEELPYGFGLHPYFQGLDGDDGTFVSLPAAAVMEADADLLPTGRLLDVAGTAFDLRRPVALGALDLDHVFTRVAPGRHARVEYRRSGLAVDLEATDDFSHLVLYTPRGEPFFCLENQTCSTDAHNLFARGFAEASGLKTVAPGAVRRGTVRYAIRAA
jgi:aldose 1-epimerase